jgi:hypothetical protein
MKPVSIKGTLKTPTVKLDPGKGLFEMKGRSTPTHSLDFFKPIMDWIDEYAEKPGDSTTFNIHFEHFNTSTSKFLLDIFKKLEGVHRDTHKVEVNWYYDHGDENIHTAGEDYNFLINIPFNFIEVEE